MCRSSTAVWILSCLFRSELFSVEDGTEIIYNENLRKFIWDGKTTHINWLIVVLIGKYDAKIK